MVRDDQACIAQELRELSASFDVVFTSGGVGPTHDDVTIDAVAEAEIESAYDEGLNGRSGRNGAGSSEGGTKS